MEGCFTRKETLNLKSCIPSIVRHYTLMDKIDFFRLCNDAQNISHNRSCPLMGLTEAVVVLDSLIKCQGIRD